MDLKEKLTELINDSLKKCNVECNKFVVERPNNKENGDYSTNVAMELTKVLHKNPREIANELVNNISDDNIIDRIEIAGPGFINFYIKSSYLYRGINEIIKLGKDYGRCNIGNEKINLEYVSANPTGILHVGTARGASYGDNMSRILSFAGYDVTREYYINDGGNQINNLGISIKTRYENLCGIEKELGEGCYHGEEIIDIAKKIYDEYKDGKLNEDLEYFTELGVNTLLGRIKDDLKEFRVEFDVWSSEKKIRQSEKIEECLKILEDEGNLYEQDGAIYMKTTNYGDDKDRVLIKNDKTYTYFVPDIAYHLDKLNRGYDKLIDVFGADHHGYVSRLKAAIEALGYDKDKLDVKLLQMVKLIKDGEEVKMSKRTGKTITIKELVEEVGINASRYFFASKGLDTQMNFDITLATKQSNENPVYYVEYAHARICSILKSVKDVMEIDEFNTIDSEYAKNLLNKVYEFKDIVIGAATKKMPHLITNYVYELATLFHTYYAHEKVITDDIRYTSERIKLIKSVQITIENALNLIGVEALTEM